MNKFLLLGLFLIPILSWISNVFLLKGLMADFTPPHGYEAPAMPRKGRLEVFRSKNFLGEVCKYYSINNRL